MTSRRRVLTQTLASSLTLAGAPVGTWANVVRSAAGRMALVIGNDRYRENPLRSAANDARAMGALLNRAGFEVNLQLDRTLEQMTAAIEALGQAVLRPEVSTALFYYAGHAAQLDWHNYLLPVDSLVESSADIRKQCVDLGLLLSRLARAKGKTSLIMLDACRDDPFGSRFRAPQKGMSQYDAPAGTLLAFATAPGRVATEPPGSSNGLYTEHLVRELSVQGVRIEDALKRVRLNVRLASRGAQVPWESTSLESDVFLFPAAKLTEADLERQFREEFQAWTRIRGSNNAADWVDYLRRYPNGKFAEVAQVHLRRLIDERDAPLASAAKPGRASALRLGPGLPVPARFRGSGNPNSAGTYVFRPVWTPGDEYVFENRDLYSAVARGEHRMVVKRVDVAGNRVLFSDGSVVDLMGGSLKDSKVRRYELPIQINPAELQVGRKWSSHFEQRGDVSGSGEYNFRVTERENVKVPAGELSAFKIEGIGSFAGRHIRLMRWLVPGINVAVRQEVRQTAAARVLVSARQAVIS